MSAGKMVTLPDGSVVITEGPPPGDDWVQDPGDSRRYHPRFIPCKHREKNVGVKPCGAISVSWFCKHKGQVISVPVCDACDVEPKV